MKLIEIMMIRDCATELHNGLAAFANKYPENIDSELFGNCLRKGLALTVAKIINDYSEGEAGRRMNYELFIAEFDKYLKTAKELEKK